MFVIYSFAFIDDSVVNFVSFFTMIVNIVLRSASIAAKYATFPKALIRRYKEHVIPMKEF